jgi:hypothetical protein
MNALKHWLLQLFIAFDQLANVLLSPLSMQTWADETISSRCGRLGHRYPYKLYKVVIDLLFRWQGPDHCVKAYKKELTRYQFPPEMREQQTEQARRERAF